MSWEDPDCRKCCQVPQGSQSAAGVWSDPDSPQYHGSTWHWTPQVPLCSVSKLPLLTRKPPHSVTPLQGCSGCCCPHCLRLPPNHCRHNTCETRGNLLCASGLRQTPLRLPTACRSFFQLPDPLSALPPWLLSWLTEVFLGWLSVNLSNAFEVLVPRNALSLTELWNFHLQCFPICSV